MPRPKEFDEAVVLDQALQLFRARGYKHTSFSDLTQELGVSRQSLYDTYGDKQTLFQTALQRYLDRSLDTFSRKLADPAPVRKVLAELFDGMIGGICGHGCHGCLMVNSMIELAPHDPEMRKRALAHAREIEGLLAARLILAQRKGEIAKSKDPVDLARFLYHIILGLAVASRAQGHDNLRKSVGVALQVLD